MTKAPPTVAKLMRDIQKLTRFGKVRLELAEDGGFWAYAYPNGSDANARVVTRLQSGEVKDVALDTFTVLMEKEQATALASGRGKQPEDALCALLVALRK